MHIASESNTLHVSVYYSFKTHTYLALWYFDTKRTPHSLLISIICPFLSHCGTPWISYKHFTFSLRNYLDCMAEFVTSKADLAHLITTLRAHYHAWILDNHSSKSTALCTEGTVAGAIQEVNNSMFYEVYGLMVSK